MKTLAEQIADKCIHFNGMMNDTCKAGVAYESVKDESRKGIGRFPCWLEGECVPCEKRRFRTPEEVAEEVAAIEESSNRCMLAMRAARDDANAHGFKKGKGGAGQVKCPCCEDGTLHYSVAGYNGHMHGQCTSDGCVSWMQ